jgi:ribosome modulation factor
MLRRMSPLAVLAIPLLLAGLVHVGTRGVDARDYDLGRRAGAAGAPAGACPWADAWRAQNWKRGWLDGWLEAREVPGG